MLQIENVSLIKGNTVILKEVTAEMRLNEISILLGKSGSGKTSLLRCLSQIETSYKGTVYLNGVPLHNLPSKQRGRLIGFVPQNYALFPHMSVIENCSHPLEITLGVDPVKAREKAEAALSSLHMDSWKTSFPSTLSGGQQQRVALARALGLNPLCLFLDEPTSALDPENTAHLAKLLKQINLSGKGVIVATQDMAFATKIADRIFLVEKGEIIEVVSRDSFAGDTPTKISEWVNV